MSTKSASSTNPASLSESTSLIVSEPNGRAFYIGALLALVSQLGWGLYPVFARVLLTQDPSLTLLELMVALNSLSGAVLAIASVGRHLVGELLPSLAAAKTSTSVPVRASLNLIVTVTLFGVVIAVRAVTNLASAGYIPAHWCMMINLTTPVFTAAIGRLIFHDPLPAGTGAALVAGLCGSALAIFGSHGDSNRDGEHTGLSTDAITGVCLAFFSSIALAVYQHCVKRTKGILSEKAILSLNYLVVLVPSIGWLMIQNLVQNEARTLEAVLALGPLQWAYLALFSVGVYVGANLLQQLAIRQIGPVPTSAVMPVRLVSSVVGSYCILGERITSAAEAIGLVIVAITAIAYLGRQVVVNSRRKLAAGGGAACDQPQQVQPRESHDESAPATRYATELVPADRSVERSEKL